MKNHVTYMMLVALVCFCVAGAQAQQVAKKKPQLRPAVEQPASLRVNNQHQEMFDNLPAEIAKAHAAYETQLQNESYFANDEIKQACHAIAGCPAWARSEFKKNTSFRVWLLNTFHYGIFAEEEDQLLRLREVRIVFFFNVGDKKMSREFQFENLLATDPRCIGCAEHIRHNYG